MDLGYRIMMTMGGWQIAWCHWARLGRGILEKVFIPNVLTLCSAGPARATCDVRVTTAQLRPGAGLASDEIWGDGADHGATCNKY